MGSWLLGEGIFVTKVTVVVGLVGCEWVCRGILGDSLLGTSLMDLMLFLDSIKTNKMGSDKDIGVLKICIQLPWRPGFANVIEGRPASLTSGPLLELAQLHAGSSLFLCRIPW